MQDRISRHRKLIALLGLSEFFVLLAAMTPVPAIWFWLIAGFFLLQAIAYPLTLIYLIFRDPEVLAAPLFHRSGHTTSLPLP